MSIRLVVTTLLAVLALPTVAHAASCFEDGRVPCDATPSRAGPRPVSLQAERPTERDERIERDIYFMPGVIGTYFHPSGGVGAFYGSGVQLAPLQWSHNNNKFGPSQGTFYVQAAFLDGSSARGTMSMYEVGMTTSFERNSNRRYLIPYFGATLGSVSQRRLGTTGFFSPMGGVHLYWHRNLMLDAEGGYHFPFEAVERYRGERAQLAARFTLW